MITGTVRIGMLRVRARYGTDAMSVIDAQDYLYDLSCLMLTGYMLGARPPADRDFMGGLTVKEASQVAIDAANDTRVRSIRYNSPLEVLLAVSSLGIAVTYFGDRLVNLYREIHETRALTASVNTHVMRERIVQRHLEQYLSGPGDERILPWIAGAARAAGDLESLDVEPDDD